MYWNGLNNSMTISSRVFFLIQICFIISFPWNCKESQLKIKSAQFCDLWDHLGECKEAWNSKKRVYTIPSSMIGQLRTWENLSHHLYFKARETPGILLHLNRDMTQEEKELLTKNCRSSYKIGNHEYEMEGKEIGKNYIGFFQYLGTILEQEKKSKQLWNQPIPWDTNHSIQIEFNINCGILKYSDSMDMEIKKS